MSSISERISKILLQTRRSISDMEKLLELLADLIESSFESNNINGLRIAIEYGEKIIEKTQNSRQRLIANYFMSNAWGDIYSITNAGSVSSWNWENKEFERQIVHLRTALNEPAFAKAEKNRRCQILTNLGNALNHIGRSVEAIEYWEKANKILPDFGMSQANLAQGLFVYGNSLHDPHDAIIILNDAYERLKKAVNMRGFHRAAKVNFRSYLSWMNENAHKFAFGNHKFKKHKSYGRTKQEVNYRKWVLRNKLFLNHLVELGEMLPEAAFDNLTLPPIVRPNKDRSSHFEGMLNQIKQEFVSARFLYYEGISSDKVHFSDRSVTLYNTLDYPSYSIAVERVKISFRLAYSLLDKIAYFLNEYLNLSISQNRVTFKTIWYQKGDKNRGLRSEFANRENWSLRGLFWLSKDLFEDSEMFQESIEPDARSLAVVRNHLEHKYLKVHEFGVLNEEFREDTLAYSIGRSEMTDKSLRILKLTRSALIYFALAIKVEEIQRDKNRDTKDQVGQLYIDTIQDDWKF
jgi:tetratricopeptide (TPR) repeat protein